MDPNSAISGPSSAHQRNVIFQGIWTKIDKKHYNFVIFKGGGVGPSVPPLDPHMLLPDFVA